jgi:hypothetical protein
VSKLHHSPETGDTILFTHFALNTWDQYFDSDVDRKQKLKYRFQVKESESDCTCPLQSIIQHDLYPFASLLLLPIKDRTT